MPSLAVVIPTYGRDQPLVDTIQQVLSQEPLPNELLIIDQTPTHMAPAQRFLEEQSRLGALRWIKQQTPNLPAARNRGLREAHCEVVLFLDDDVILSENLIGAHLRHYARSEVAAVAGRIIQPRASETLKADPPQASMSHRLDYLRLRLDSEDYSEGIATFGGGNHSVRRETMLQTGGYDEHYVGWAFREDSDAAIRLWETGHTIVYDPEASLTHLAAPSGGCRLPGRGGFPLAEWKISFPANYFAFRHLFPTLRFWQELLLYNVRRYVLRRENVLHAWRLPSSALQYLYAAIRAGVIARTVRHRPFPNMRPFEAPSNTNETPKCRPIIT